ncbi:MAG: tetratricopeptide repeat protein [Saprospiraceae bacterium]|nr:tetratricopeptide repeat protein [Saprospiraceae bacterium]
MEENDIERIDRFLRGEMDKAETQAFEQALSENPELQKKMKIQQELVSYIDLMGDQEVLANIRKAEDTYRSRKAGTIKKMSWLRPALIAASLALLLFVGWWFLMPSSEPDVLYASFYQPYELSFSSRDGGNAETLLAANAAYNAQDYAQALQAFERLPVDLQTSKVKLAMGISHMELSSFGSALSLFDQIIELQDPLFLDQALWYKGLCLLKQERLDEASTVFQEVVNNANSIFNQEASRLLKRLK